MASYFIGFAYNLIIHQKLKKSPSKEINYENVFEWSFILFRKSMAGPISYF